MAARARSQMMPYALSLFTTGFVLVWLCLLPLGEPLAWPGLVRHVPACSGLLWPGLACSTLAWYGLV